MKFIPRELRDTADASRGDHTWTSFLKNTASVILILGFLYLLLGLVADVVAWTLPERWEAATLGAELRRTFSNCPRFMFAECSRSAIRSLSSMSTPSFSPIVISRSAIGST